ncbi:MAG: hypothetical protein K9K78_05295 [Spirochaetales bacterium]|nr:hypothetical protein [Spirochaetales bacterium]
MKFRSMNGFVGILVLLAVLLAVLSGCQMLGMANPFSSGQDDFKRAKGAWEDGNPAEALEYVTKAINDDEKHWGAYKFLFEIYGDAMEQVDAKLASLDAQNPTIDSTVEKVETLQSMKYFNYYVEGFPGEETNPKIVSYKKDSLTIPLTDYEVLLSEARAQGYELAFTEAANQIDGGDYEAALASLDIIPRHFVPNYTEDRRAAGAEIAEFLAENAAPMVENLTITNLEDAAALITAAREFAETDRNAALLEELNTKAVNVVFDEAAKLLDQDGSVEGMERALRMAERAREYVEDSAEVNRRIYPYAQKLADLYKSELDASIHASDGTRDNKWDIENQYVQYVEFVIYEWPDVTGHEQVIENFADYIESTRTVVHVVLNPGYTATRDRISANVEQALSDHEGSVMWIYSEKNQEIADQRARYFRGEGRRWYLDNQELADRLIYPDSSTAFLNEVNKLTTESSLVDARAFNIDYLVRIDAKVSTTTPESSQRDELQQVSAYQKQDGSVHFSKSLLEKWRTQDKIIQKMIEATDYDQGAIDAAAAEYKRQMEEAGISKIWYDVDVTNTYQNFTATVSVNYDVDVVRTSDGKNIYSTSLTHQDNVSSDRVLVGVSSANSAMEKALQADVREPASDFKPNTKSVVTEGLSEFDDTQVVQAIVRD